MIKAGIIGASGYAAGELIRYLIGHPGAEITYLASGSLAGKHIGATYPNLLGHDLPVCEGYSKDAFDRADIFFLAQHNGQAMGIAGKLLDVGRKVIDIGADFRFRDASVYEKWYKLDHTAPELARTAVYGLPELKRDAIRGASLVANPGCYCTSAILALAPIVAAGFVDLKSIIVDSKSGVSGAGRYKFELGYMFAEIDESLRAYGIANHRHTPEIEQELGELAGEQVCISFTPHLVPMIRGILSTSYAKLTRELSTAKLLDLYRAKYGGSPFVVVLDEGQFPTTKSVCGSNYCHIGLKVDDRTGRVVVVSAIDNMGKGAAGQAVQNMNLMFGLAETTGLDRPAIYP